MSRAFCFGFHEMKEEPGAARDLEISGIRAVAGRKFQPVDDPLRRQLVFGASPNADGTTFSSTTLPKLPRRVSAGSFDGIIGSFHSTI